MTDRFAMGLTATGGKFLSMTDTCTTSMDPKTGYTSKSTDVCTVPDSERASSSSIAVTLTHWRTLQFDGVKVSSFGETSMSLNLVDTSTLTSTSG